MQSQRRPRPRLRPPPAARAVAVSFALLFCVQCSGFFGGVGKALVSEKDEARIGAEFDRTLRTNDTARREMPVFEPSTPAEAALRDYIVGLGRELVAAVPESEKPSYDFHFTLIDKDVENAFAVPGGYVYIYTGILRKMHDESELMGVLGHEITHVTHHHYREQLAKNAALGIALQSVLAAADAGQGARMAAGAAFQLANLKFSRGDETEADKVGTILLGRVGRNPMGIAKYFARAEKVGIPEWLMDHPGNDHRVKTITDLVNDRPKLKELAELGAATTYAERYRNHIEPLPASAGK